MSESAIVRAVAQKAARRITRKVVASLQKMTDTLSGDDSKLRNVWDEICAQVQHQDSFYWDAYDETVRGIVRAQLAHLSKDEKEAIWLQTEAGLDWTCKEEVDRNAAPVCDNEIAEWFVEEYIYDAAKNWSNPRIRAYLDRASIED
jgi:hypothetical protein